MKRPVYLPAALAHLKAITLYIADDNPDRAASFVEELRAKAV
jgi:toxin ParE1/3/4